MDNLIGSVLYDMQIRGLEQQMFFLFVCLFLLGFFGFSVNIFMQKQGHSQNSNSMLVVQD